MPNTLESILMSGLGVVTAGLVFLYKANDATQAKLKEEHQATIAAMLSDLKAERASCQKENELMRQDINKLQEQLLKLHQEYGELKGRLSSLASQEKHEHDQV